MVLTLILLPGSFSTSCMAISLQSLRTVGGTLLSSSQYLEGAWAYRAAGVACVTRAVVTIPVDLPGGEIDYNIPIHSSLCDSNWIFGSATKGCHLSLYFSYMDSSLL